MAGLKIAECMSEYDEFRQGFEDSSPSIPFQFVRKLAKEGKLPGNRCYLPELENDLDDGSQKRIGEIQQYQQHSAANCKVMGGMARFVDITEQDDEDGEQDAGDVDQLDEAGCGDCDEEEVFHDTFETSQATTP